MKCDKNNSNLEEKKTWNWKEMSSNIITIFQHSCNVVKIIPIWVKSHQNIIQITHLKAVKMSLKLIKLV